MNNVSLALCIPTYERDKIVEDFLINCSAYYIQAGIDIYYYDSSVSDKTKDVVCGWPDQEHIHYVRLPSDLHVGVKESKILQRYGLKKEYDFIWLSGDSLQFTKTVLEQFVSNLSLDYDIVEINSIDYERIGSRTFTDPNEYLWMCAWHLGQLGNTALNSHTMLEGVDWAFYEEKILRPNLLDFVHVSFYFYRILELEQFHALHLSVPSSQCKISKLKKVSGWVDNFFSVLCEGWVQTIEGLPDFYTTKGSACVKLGDLSLIDRIDRFYQFRKHGVYSLKIYLKYKNVWNKVTSFSSIQLLAVACMPQFLIKLYEKTYRIFLITKLRIFCKKHSRIIIYGAGDNGEIYDQLFKREGLSYDAFCVSHRKPNKTKYLQHPVCEFDEIKSVSKEIGFVIALSEEHTKEVLPTVYNTIDKKHIFYEADLQKSIRLERGYWYV